MPANLTINSSTGLISGVLASGSAGSYNVQLTVTDGNGGVDGTIFYWTVNASGGGNQAPTITPPGNQTDDEGDNISLQISASDPDGDTLSYSASGKVLIIISSPAFQNWVGTIYKNSAVPAMDS